MRVLSLFDGIACGLQTLKNLGIKVDAYYASEIDEGSIQIAKNNHPEIIHVGDVQNLKSENFLLIDLVIGGSPCQGFSLAGKGLGYADPRSKLFFDYVRLVNEIKPKYFFLENNRMQPDDVKVANDHLGVKGLKINSRDVSHQNRVRLYWNNFQQRIFIPKNPRLHLSQIIGDYEGIWVYPRGHNPGGINHYKGKCPCITTSTWENNFYKVIKGKKVQFTPEELEQVQGLPVGYTRGLSSTQRIKRIGNGWSIPTIELFFKHLRNK